MTREKQFCLPDLGEGLTQADIVTWHVGVGDRVVTDQPLVSVETDKAIVEIPSPRSGTIAALFGACGDRIAVGDKLVEFTEGTADAGAIVGRIPTRASGAVKASPAVRRLAAEHGVDLAAVTGTGPGGAILSADVEQAAGGKPPQSLESLSNVRRAMAERMADAQRRVAPATVTAEADIANWTSDSRPMPRLIRAICAACRAHPRLNAAYDDVHYRLTLQESVDLGIAMDLEDGLFVPVLRNAAILTARETEAELEALEQAVRSRTISPASLRGQSITLSNFGSIGGMHAAMVVVPPQVAIVGAGQVFERVVIVDGSPLSHRTLPLSMTIDHRAITGGEASRFLVALVNDLERAD